AAGFSPPIMLGGLKPAAPPNGVFENRDAFDSTLPVSVARCPLPVARCPGCMDELYRLFAKQPTTIKPNTGSIAALSSPQ
ncbi:MAG TPA: hypothetical protein VF911_18945, partial [Thermoanaerobaculia bacterium]